jgi:hypothetical protein
MLKVIRRLAHDGYRTIQSGTGIYIVKRPESAKKL